MVIAMELLIMIGLGRLVPHPERDAGGVLHYNSLPQRLYVRR